MMCRGRCGRHGGRRSNPLLPLQFRHTLLQPVDPVEQQLDDVGLVLRLSARRETQCGYRGQHTILVAIHENAVKLVLSPARVGEVQRLLCFNERHQTLL